MTTQIIPLSIDQLTEIGVTCYGPNWKAALCLAVSSTGLASLSERRLRYILSGRERVQEDVERGLLLVLQKRKREIESTIARMFKSGVQHETQTTASVDPQGRDQAHAGEGCYACQVRGQASRYVAPPRRVFAS